MGLVIAAIIERRWRDDEITHEKALKIATPS
jgi:hypothetical protein